MSGWETELFPALELWRRRIGTPREGRRDALWRAAMWDAVAKERLAAGQSDAAWDAWRQARAIEDEEFEGLMDLPDEGTHAAHGRRTAVPGQGRLSPVG